MRYLFLVVFLLLGSWGLCEDEGEERDGRLVDLLNLCYENARSFRNYDVTISYSSVFNPTDEESKAPPYLKELHERAVMDWEKESYFRLSRNTIETTYQSPNCSILESQYGFRAAFRS